MLLLAMARPARLYVSAPILSEYRIVLSRREFEDSKRPAATVPSTRSKTVPTLSSLRAKSKLTSDPDDNIFLECADAARADYLVTGNRRHFPEFWKQTKIVTSREFVSLIAPHLAPVSGVASSFPRSEVKSSQLRVRSFSV